MSVTISPELEAKIERRARRAWRYSKREPKRQFHRITNVKEKELEYRVPYTPNYYGKKKVKVVLTEADEVVVDPPSTGKRELLKTSDIDLLKNETGKLHAGEITGYIVTDKTRTAGKFYKKSSGVMSRERAKSSAKHNNFVYVVKVAAGALKALKHDSCEVSGFTVESQLDPVKDLGLTDGLIDLLAVGDIEKIKKHTDKFHAYVRVKPKGKALTVGKRVTKQYQVADLDKVVSEVTRDDKVYRIEADVSKVVQFHGNSSIEVKGVLVVAELDPEKDLGFTSGLLDCQTKDDVLKLQKNKHFGRVRAYKYTDKDAESPIMSPKLKYVPGKDYEIKDANTDPASNCHTGINVADYSWAKGNTHGENRLFAFEFDVEDIAAVPTYTDGKFRVKRCKCIEEIDVKTGKPIAPPPRPLETNVKKVKKKGFMEKLFGSKDEGKDED
jgi:hypothetical protein